MKISVLTNGHETMTHMQNQVVTLVNEYQSKVVELEAIYVHMTELKEILGSHEGTCGEGLKRIEIAQEGWEQRLIEPSCGDLERKILNLIKDYLGTKTVQLFNYRTIEGAPATNNFEESQFYLLKHQIRRTIGQSSAKEYLARHGPNLFFIKLDAEILAIINILQVTDQIAVRKMLDQMRPSRFCIGALLHKEYA